MSFGWEVCDLTLPAVAPLVVVTVASAAKFSDGFPTD